MAFDLSIELRAFLLELESYFFELFVPHPQLLYPQMRWGPYIPLDLIVEVVVRITAAAEMLLHQNRDAWLATVRRLVD